MYVGVLDFDYYVGVVFQVGCVYLGDGGVGQWFGIDLFVQSVQGSVEFCFYGFVDIMEWQWWCVVQVFLEFVDVFFWEQ